MSAKSDKPLKERNRDRARERRARGLCSSCNNPALPGKTSCQACTEATKRRYEARKASHKCLRCKEPLAPEDGVHCPACAEIDRQNHLKVKPPEPGPDGIKYAAHKARYEDRKKKCICVKCGEKPNELAITGRGSRIYCVACSEAKKQRLETYRRNLGVKPMSEREGYKSDKEKYEARKASNICVYCGKNQPVPGMVRCSTCAEIYLTRQREKYAEADQQKAAELELVKKQRSEAGQCLECGNAEVYLDEMCRLCWVIDSTHKGMTRMQAAKMVGLCGCCLEYEAIGGGTRCLKCLDVAEVVPDGIGEVEDPTIYEARKAKGLCGGCGQCPPLNGIVFCKVCLEKQRARQKKYAEEAKAAKEAKLVALVAQRKADGHCLGCGNVEVFQEEHCKLCWVNLQEKVGIPRYQARKAVGLCQYCPSPVEAVGKPYCQKCRERYLQRRRDMVAKGLCPCGLPQLPGKKRCEDCTSKRRFLYRERLFKGLCNRCGVKPHVENKKMCQECADKFNVRRKLQTRRLRDKIFEEYGGAVCVCCGCRSKLSLSLDHIYNDGNIHRAKIAGNNQCGGATFYQYLKKNGFPDKDRIVVLCMGCNVNKHRNGGTCPHTTWPPELLVELKAFNLKVATLVGTD